MKNLLRIPIFLLFIVAITYSCKKEDLFEKSEISSPILKQFNNTNKFDFGGEDAQLRNGTNPKPTILGPKRNNPYTVQKMTEAYNNLYLVPISSLPTTNLYVQFCPEDYEEYIELLELDLVLYDYPLEYEVIEMGDYYDDPNIPNDEIPCFYAIVEPNFNFPVSNYEILENLYLDKSNLMLVAESYRITGNARDIKSDVFGSKGLIVGDIDDDIQGIPEEPDCPSGCTAVYTVDDSGATNPPAWEWICQCEPVLPPTTNPPNPNDFQCVGYSSARKPAGRIQVVDTELGIEGVRRVMVIMKDSWFTQNVVWTDDNGCFKIDRKYFTPALMWVEFRNTRARIRTYDENIWRFLTTHRHLVGFINGPIYNDILVTYAFTNVNASLNDRNWSAATVNNALHEFYDEASSDIIFTPPSNLDIFLGEHRRDGFALMNHFIEPQGVIDALSSAYLPTSVLLSPYMPIIGSYTPLLFLITFAPDIMIGTDFTNSDRLKRLAYHEFAHGSHFSQVGKNYWKDVIEAEAQDGHGDQFSDDAGLIAVVESWAEFIAMTYTHRKYPSEDLNSIDNTWLDILDARWNESANHIPIGVHHDLIDIGEPIQSCDEDELVNGLANCTTGISDNVSGFTIAQMYLSLHEDITSPTQYRDELISLYLGLTNAGTAADVTALFSSY